MVSTDDRQVMASTLRRISLLARPRSLGRLVSLPIALPPPRSRLPKPSVSSPITSLYSTSALAPAAIMDFDACVQRLRSGAAVKFPPDANSVAFAQHMDGQDKLRHLRDEFVLPTKASLKKKSLDGKLPREYTHVARPKATAPHSM